MVVPPAATPSVPQTLAARLERLRALAVTVLNTHTNDSGLCAACRGVWSCEPAAVAEHTVAAL